MITQPVRMGNNKTWKVEELAGGAWEGKIEKHSCRFELLTIVRLCEHMSEEWTGKRAHICTDNVGAAFISGEACMASPELNALALRLCGVSMKLTLTHLTLTHVR